MEHKEKERERKRENRKKQKKQTLLTYAAAKCMNLGWVSGYSFNIHLQASVLLFFKRKRKIERIRVNKIKNKNKIKKEFVKTKNIPK